jgi:hypothetical protein
MAPITKRKVTIAAQKLCICLALVVIHTQTLAQGSIPRAAQQSPLSARLIAQAEGSAEIGHETPLGDRAKNPLKVPVGRRVTLTISTERSTPNRQFSYFWKQLGGPSVEWLTRSAPGGIPDLTSRMQWRAKKAGIHEFECRVMLLDSNKIPTGVQIVKRITIVVVPSSSK